MSENIKPGDVAVVVKWPCCGKYIGHVFTVSTTDTIMGPTLYCTSCLQTMDRAAQFDTTIEIENDKFYKWPTQFIKKIPPLSDTEKTEFLESLKDEVRV